MILSHRNLLWDVPSPSFWRLHLEGEGDTVDINYLGTRGEWTMIHADTQGNVSTRCFPSRDDAIDLVVQAFQNVGGI